MKIALISDIHSNIYAFEAVLGDLKTQSVDLTVFLGDIVYGGIYPRECLSILMNIEPLIAIKGNADGRFDETDDIGNKNNELKDHRDEIHCWVRDLMSKKEIQEIRNFKSSESIFVNEMSIGFYHGSPKSYNDRIYDDDSDKDIMEKFRDVQHSITAIGHTHVRMHKKISGLEIINPGAIGISNDGDIRAGYGILTMGKQPIFEQKNIEYPLEKYIDDFKQSEMPYKNNIVEQLKTGEPNKLLFRPK